MHPELIGATRPSGIGALDGATKTREESGSVDESAPQTSLMV